MNVEKLRRLQSQVRIGGKGTARRKKKVMHQTATTDDKKLQSSLKKLSVSTIPGIEEVNIIKDDLTVIHFNNPKAQASLSANTFAVTGHGETKKIVEMLPEILPQLGQETVVQLRMFANSMTSTKTTGGADASVGTNMLYSVVEEDDVPMLVSDFDEVAKLEAAKTTNAATANSEKPASESDKDENTVKNNAVIKETVAELPILSDVISHTEAFDDAEKKVIELQPLENSNSNIKLAAESEQKLANSKAVNNEKEHKKQKHVNLKQEDTNKIDKEQSKKSNEPQKKIENKTQPKAESLKQKAKPEQKAQKGSKEHKNYAEAAVNTNNSKTEDEKKDGKTEEAQDTVSKQKKTPENQQKKDKLQQQQQQPEQNQHLQQQQKQADVVEYIEKLQQAEKLGSEDQQTNTNTKKQDSQVQQHIQKPKPTQQQQQKGDQQIKQKNKPGQQKQPNQTFQSKTDIDQRTKKSEAQQPTKQPTAKQQEKVPKATEDTRRFTDKQLEPIKVSKEKQTTDTVGNQRKAENFGETQAKGLQKPNNNEQKPKAQTPPKEKQQDEKVEEKCQQDISSSKDERQTEIGVSIADVSIKTVALQSLKSTEKVLGLVNEITKELTTEDLKECNEHKEEVSSGAQLPVEAQLKATTIAENVKDTSEQTESSPPASLNIDSINTVVIPVADLQDNKLVNEANRNIVDNLARAVDCEGKPAVDNETSKSEDIENIADNSSNVEQSRSDAKEDVQLSKEPTLAQILQSQTSPPTTVKKTIGEQLDNQPSSGEVGAILPATSLVGVKISLGGEEKPNERISIAADLLSKQPTIAEVLQSQPPRVASETTPLPKTPLADEVKKIDLMEVKSDLLTTEESKSIDLSQVKVVKATTPERVTALPENKTVKQQNTEKKSNSASVSPKQTTSSPKQTASTKGLQEAPKQQAKASTGIEVPKAITPDDVKLKLATKPQPGQQQQTQPKGKPKPTPNKSAPTTPTTPTKITPEKSLAAQKSTTLNTKSSIETASKKANLQQKQQSDATAKSKQTQGAGVKAVRTGGGNASIATGGTKKANTPTATNKSSTNTGAKQQGVGPQDITIGRPTVAEGTTTPISPPPAAPATQNTANSNTSSQHT